MILYLKYNTTNIYFFPANWLFVSRDVTKKGLWAEHHWRPSAGLTQSSDQQHFLAGQVVPIPRLQPIQELMVLVGHHQAWDQLAHSPSKTQWRQHFQSRHMAKQQLQSPTRAFFSHICCDSGPKQWHGGSSRPWTECSLLFLALSSQHTEKGAYSVHRCTVSE